MRSGWTLAAHDNAVTRNQDLLEFVRDSRLLAAGIKDSCSILALKTLFCGSIALMDKK
jgi:hypothetical protein